MGKPKIAWSSLYVRCRQGANRYWSEADNNDLCLVLAYVAELEGALRGCERLFKEALPKFNWGASALDANAIKLLNDVPCKVEAALTSGEKGGG